MALFYKEVGAAYPDAKFLLSTRDPHDWYRSMRTAIIKPRNYLEKPPISWIFSLFSIVQNKELFHRVRALSAAKLGMNHSSWSAVYAGEDAAVRFFTAWHAKMVDTIPAEKLLVYNVKEGWEPLARMLGVKIPEEPFPQINDGLTISLIVIGGYYILVVVIPVVVGVVLYAKCSTVRSLTQKIFGACLRKPFGWLRGCGLVKNDRVVKFNEKNNHVKYSRI